jgi:hypothetical protein
MAITDLLHKNLTGAQLHEPKGIEKAEEETVYVANGEGSGEWKQLPLNSVSFDRGRVSSANVTDMEDIKELDSASLVAVTDMVVSNTESFQDCDKNFKELCEQVEEIKRELTRVFDNTYSLYSTLETLRQSLLNSGIVKE